MPSSSLFVVRCLGARLLKSRNSCFQRWLGLRRTLSTTKSYNDAIELISCVGRSRSLTTNNNNNHHHQNDDAGGSAGEAAIGEELVGSLDRSKVVKVLNEFFRLPQIRSLAKDNGLDTQMFQVAFSSFKRMCLAGSSGYVGPKKNLPVDLHIVLYDIINSTRGKGTSHVSDIAPYFLKHAQTSFPHLMCIEDLKKISDLREPPNWYCEARSMSRKFIYHAGPTNSGKTYQAIQRFLSASSGVYCGPLKLLATEVAVKSCKQGVDCDLITGEERKLVDPEGNPSPHTSCTIEMTNLNTKYEVAVVDEVQMVRDLQRGWAWTRVLLGICADEIHLCGEASAIGVVDELVLSCGDELEVRNYERLSKLVYLDKALENFSACEPGDCFVCFSKRDIFTITRELDKLGIESAVIYGSLPPGSKIGQAKRFNDPEDPCKVMVATDAIGMGLNLNIKRIIFYSLMKPQLSANGESEVDIISTSQALQIAGRAGRFNSEFENGEVTTFCSRDLPVLHDILSREVEPIQKVGLHPTADQIELLAYHLPKNSLSNLLQIFTALCRLNSDLYFLCNIDDFKFLADLIDHVPLDLRSRYVFCCAPINRKEPFLCTMFLKFARMYSRRLPVTHDWLLRQIGWPFRAPGTINDLIHLEAVYDVLDLCLWLSYRFADVFGCDVHLIRDTQVELDEVIGKGVSDIVQLLERSISAFADDSPINGLYKPQLNGALAYNKFNNGNSNRT